MKYCIKCGYKLSARQAACPGCGRSYLKLPLEEKNEPEYESEPQIIHITANDHREIKPKQGMSYGLVFLLTLAILGGGSYTLKLWSDKEAEHTASNVNTINEKSEDEAVEDPFTFQAAKVIYGNHDGYEDVTANDKLIVDFAEEASALNSSSIEEFTILYEGEAFTFNDFSLEDLSLSPSHKRLEMRFTNSSTNEAQKLVSKVIRESSKE